MADKAGSSSRPGLVTALPYVLTVAGGLAGVAVVNVTDHGSPLFGIVIGALIGKLAATLLGHFIERRTHGTPDTKKTGSDV